MDRNQLGSPLAADIEQEIRDLYATEAAGLLRHAASAAGNGEAAQDAVQEAFLRFFIARTAGQEIRNPRAWLFRVLRNHVLDQKKLGSRHEIGLESVMNSPGPGYDPEAAYGRVEALRATLRTGLTRAKSSACNCVARACGTTRSPQGRSNMRFVSPRSRHRNSISGLPGTMHPPPPLTAIRPWARGCV